MTGNPDIHLARQQAGDPARTGAHRVRPRQCWEFSSCLRECPSASRHRFVTPRRPVTGGCDARICDRRCSPQAQTPIGNALPSLRRKRLASTAGAHLDWAALSTQVLQARACDAASSGPASRRCHREACRSSAGGSRITACAGVTPRRMWAAVTCVLRAFECACNSGKAPGMPAPAKRAQHPVSHEAG